MSRFTRRLARVLFCAVLTVAIVPAWAVPTAAAKIYVPVYRFYNAGTGSHFYTASEEERALVSLKYPAIYVFEGIAYWTYPEDVIVPNGPSIDFSRVPLHRFYNKQNGSHFYTISEAEKAFVQANYSAVYTYEGTAYSVLNGADLGPAMPVHRFYNKQNGSHFYTISEAEKAYIRLHYSDTYQYEGISFYALPNDYFMATG